MVGQIGSADDLRIEQALARGDPATVEALALQYCGTPGAASACQWLGDRALAAADLAPAAAWYREGFRGASPAQRPELAARMRLVSAMLGSAQGQPPTQPISFGSLKVSPQQFEGWIRDQLSRRRIVTDAASPADSLPLVAACATRAIPGGHLWPNQQLRGTGFKANELQFEVHDVDWTWRHLTGRGEDSALAVERARVPGLRPGGRKGSLEFPLGNAMSPRPVWPPAADRESTSVPLWPATGPEWSALRAVRAATGGSAIVAALRPAIRSGTAGGSLSSQSGRPARARRAVVSGGTASRDGRRGFQAANHGITAPDRLPSECQVSWAGNRLIVLVAGCVIAIDLQGRIIWLVRMRLCPA